MNAGRTVKSATTAAALHPILAKRWSPRGFDAGHELTTEQTTALLEAARWAPSANKSQPLAIRGYAARHRRVQGDSQFIGAEKSGLGPRCLRPDRRGGRNGQVGRQPQPMGLIRPGQAVAHLTVQAEHEGLAVHQMGGSDCDRLETLLELPAHLTPLVVAAVGRRGQTSQLPESFASREDAARERRPLTDLLIPTESVRTPVAA